MEKTQRFTWNGDKVLSLIESTYHFKVLMEYNNVDFQGDKPYSLYVSFRYQSNHRVTEWSRLTWWYIFFIFLLNLS